MTDIDRRTLLRAGAGAALAGPLAGFAARAASGAPPRPPGLTELVARPDLRDGEARLALPRGFHYRSFQPTGEAMADGTLVPARHDGMGAFGPGRDRNRSRLVRNHEINGSGTAFSASAPTYDPGAPGGTTTALVTDDGRVRDSWASLAGTQMNCSGGRMPWGSWVTCEETVNGVDVYDDFTRGALPPETYVVNAGLTKPHGFLFEVPAQGTATAEPVRKAGRFAHEALAYVPRDRRFYLTEDDFGFASGFYRYTPPSDPRVSRRLEDGGTLEALAVTGTPNAHLEASWPVGTRFPVSWVPI
jgi:secreted PhoX family phosphatase